MNQTLTLQNGLDPPLRIRSAPCLPYPRVAPIQRLLIAAAMRPARMTGRGQGLHGQERDGIVIPLQTPLPRHIRPGGGLVPDRGNGQVSGTLDGDIVNQALRNGAERDKSRGMGAEELGHGVAASIPVE